MNLLEIIIIAVIAVCAFAGYRRGFVRKLASMLSLVLSLVLVSIFLPYITDFLKESTPVYDYITRQCRQVVAEQVTENVTSDSSSQAEAYENMSRDEIKALMEQYGYDSSVIDSLSDEQLESYKEQYLQQYIEQYLGGTADTGAESGSQLTRTEQMELIENLPLPEALKDLLINYNNDEGYESLGVSTFQEYIINFIANVILNVLSFIVAVILVQILLRIAIGALDILAHIPVINIVNRFAGLLLGLVQALFLIWIFFLILSMISATEVGLNLMSMVQESSALSWLYDSNLFLQIVIQAASIFV